MPIEDDIIEVAARNSRSTSRSFINLLYKALREYIHGDTSKERTREILSEKLYDMGLIDSSTDKGNASQRMSRLGSKMRLDLITDTVKQQASSLKKKEESEDPFMKQMFPAWEFIRDEYRMNKRDWQARWAQAKTAVGGKGVADIPNRMIALKSSPIWRKLGTMFKDSIGTDFPPFAFGSGMGWREINRDECERFGLDVS